ncbi:MAG: glycosyltransferase [Phototrophicaceae bacterium]
MADFILILITSSLITIALIAILNALTFPRLGRASHSPKTPLVSVLIPARNEQNQIGNTLQALTQQTYPHLEVLILDDQSTDATPQIIESFVKQDARFVKHIGRTLPTGWSGKNWACHQLSEYAQGDILIFTDADVEWSPSAVQSLVNEIQTFQSDLTTVWATQTTLTWTERAVVPLMSMVIMGYLPALAVHHTPFPTLAAANGQCMAFRRQAYHQIGGHQSVKNVIVEDIQLARRIKQFNLRLRMVDGNQLIRCRMYHSWDEVRNGFAKNILAGYGNSIFALLLATLFHWALFLMPSILCLFALITNQPLLLGWSLSWVALALLIRGLTAQSTHQRLADSILLPYSVMLMSIIAVQAIWWDWKHGGPIWKNRTISREQA